MEWALKDPKRFLFERAQIAELEKEGWIKAAVWRLRKGLLIEVDVDMEVHGRDYAVTLTYPDLFPETAGYIRPRNLSELWSGHQYGRGGVLCLEWREDNWQSSVTGADLLRSAYKLLSSEQNPDQPVAVPSAHHLTEGQELRSSNAYRLVVTSGALGVISALSVPASIRIQTTMVFHKGPNILFLSQVEGESGAMHAAPDLPAGLVSGAPIITLVDDGHVFRHDAFEAPDGISSVAELENALQGAGFSAELIAACKSAPGDYRHHVVVLMDRERVRAAFGVSGGDQPKLRKYGLVLARNSASRLPAEFSGLGAKRVGLVGSGSLGGKVAVSLARSGVRKFLAVDDDILLPDNLCRNEMSWASVGLHKVQALEEELSLIATGIEVKTYIHRVGGQESAMRAERVLNELGTCDLLIDATADPAVFLRLAAAARKSRKPLLWGEVFAGGIGGLIARADPRKDPHPASVRSAILSYYETLPEAPFRNAVGYDGTPEEPVVASDADVGQIASALARLVLDTLLQRDEFPYAAYLIGLRRAWIFEQPFDTRPIEITGEEWEEHIDASESETSETVKALLAMAAQPDAESDPSA